MGDRGMCIMETWLAEHAPEALPLKPVSTLARMPTLGSGHSLVTHRRLPDGGLAPYRSVNLKSVPTLTRGNTLNSNNDRMLAKLVRDVCFTAAHPLSAPPQAHGSDRYAPFAQMVREVLASNLELAKQLRAGAQDAAATKSDDAFQGLEVSPSLAKALDELQRGGEYKGDEVEAFFLDPTFNGIKQAEADAQVPAASRKRVRIDPLAALVSLLFLGGLGFYLAWRIIFTLPGLGSYLPYGIAVLAVECLGAMSLIPYALTIMWYTAKEEPPSTTLLHYHVRLCHTAGDGTTVLSYVGPCAHPLLSRAAVCGGQDGDRCTLGPGALWLPQDAVPVRRRARPVEAVVLPCAARVGARGGVRVWAHAGQAGDQR